MVHFVSELCEDSLCWFLGLKMVLRVTFVIGNVCVAARRDAMHKHGCRRAVSLCLSVCPSCSCILSKQQALKPDIGSESRFLHLHSTHRVRGVPVGVLLCRLARKKLKWCGYPTVKKIMMIYLFVLTQLTNVTDTRTHTQTDAAWLHRPRLCIASRGKNRDFRAISGFGTSHCWTVACRQHFHGRV